MDHSEGGSSRRDEVRRRRQIEAAPDRKLPPRHRDRRTDGPLGDNLVDQAQPKGAFCRHGLAREQRCQGRRGPDQSRKALRSAGTRQQPQPDLRQPERATCLCDPVVARQRELEATA